MENISVDLRTNTIIVVLPRQQNTDLEAMQEASKILQREIMRRENNSDKRFHW